jgi:hypothetical protein
MSKFSIWKRFKRTIKSGGWDWLERFKTVVEIAAIFVGGWWAYTLFFEAEAPSLNLRADINGSLTWYKISNDRCQAEYEIEFHNIGKRSVDVEQVCFHVWNLTELSKISQESQVIMLDPMTIRAGSPVLEKCTDRLVQKYEPDERNKNGFSFMVRRSPGKLMLFQVDISGKAGKQSTSWTDYRWDYVCEENPNESAEERANDSSNSTPR